ncbi:hypothetical protein LCGC14_3085680 [marine sediment metagenome]|uniref:2-amino-4-hydroxy-6-hydroxymethyldihydropteridine diphosphokinase n=1 Tax=marine sediment metagenome TaxID=412755 RepID=A0A0F8X0K3_9ZZZZ
MATAYIGLGSNIGEREHNLKIAVQLLKETGGVVVANVSSIYETTPVGYLDQPDFLNAVVMLNTSLEPKDLLHATKQIEKKEKRQRSVHWGPRTIDLDILLYDDLELDDPGLRLPHPEARERAFVLVPLVEIAPDLSYPEGKKARDYLLSLGKTRGVRLYKSNWFELDSKNNQQYNGQGE